MKNMKLRPVNERGAFISGAPLNSILGGCNISNCLLGLGSRPLLAEGILIMSWQGCVGFQYPTAALQATTAGYWSFYFYEWILYEQIAWRI